MSHNNRSHCGPLQKLRRKEEYSAQKAITEANRRRKQLKHMKLHPNDLQAVKLL